jgi:hypothetical protein
MRPESARANLKRRQEERSPAVMAKLEADRPAAIITVEELTALIEATDGETVAIIVHRAKRQPKFGQAIRLAVNVHGALRHVVYSSEDKKVEHVGGHNYRGHWRKADLLLWLAQTEGRRK